MLTVLEEVDEDDDVEEIGDDTIEDDDDEGILFCDYETECVHSIMSILSSSLKESVPESTYCMLRGCGLNRNGSGIFSTPTLFV